ncbi:MAG: hypothetical protein ACPGSM_04255 [Thiolinea sp.]
MRSISLSRLPVASPALFLGGLLWVAAFWFPVFETPERTIAGYWVFATGWMGFAMFQFAWYANLLMLMAVIMMYTAPLRATLLAAAGLLVATQAFWFDVLPGSASSTPITGQGLGFWFWYSSIFLLGLGVVFGSDDASPEEVVQREEQQVVEIREDPVLTEVAPETATESGSPLLEDNKPDKPVQV